MENDRRIAISQDQFWAFVKRLTVPFMLVSIASIVLVALTPIIGNMTGATYKPTFMQMLIVGGGVIALTFAFLCYAAKVIGLTASWLAVSGMFGVAFVVLQFIIGPQALYLKGEYDISGFFTFNPNQLSTYWWIAAAVLLSLLLVMGIAYRVYRDRAKIAAGIQIVVKKPKTFLIIFTVFALIVLGIVTGYIYIPFILVFPTLNYAEIIATQFSLIVPLMLLMAAFVGAVLHINLGGEAAIVAKKDAILAMVLWIGLALLFLYSTLWIVYMTLLVTTWPLKTFTSSSK